MPCFCVRSVTLAFSFNGLSTDFYTVRFALLPAFFERTCLCPDYEVWVKIPVVFVLEAMSEFTSVLTFDCLRVAAVYFAG